VALQKDGEDHFDLSCDKTISVILIKGGKEYLIYNEKKVD
jgi:hypothetical protein